MATLYLASGSPRRRELLTQIALPFTTLIAPIDENILSDETPHAYVERLARAKAQAGLALRPLVFLLLARRKLLQSLARLVHLLLLRGACLALHRLVLVPEAVGVHLEEVGEILGVLLLPAAATAAASLLLPHLHLRLVLLFRLLQVLQRLLLG